MKVTRNTYAKRCLGTALYSVIRGVTVIMLFTNLIEIRGSSKLLKIPYNILYNVVKVGDRVFVIWHSWLSHYESICPSITSLNSIIVCLGSIFMQHRSKRTCMHIVIWFFKGVLVKMLPPIAILVIFEIELCLHLCQSPSCLWEKGKRGNKLMSHTLHCSTIQINYFLFSF